MAAQKNIYQWFPRRQVHTFNIRIPLNDIVCSNLYTLEVSEIGSLFQKVGIMINECERRNIKK
jgi:hypothetical protein